MKRILIGEDSSITINITQKILEKQSYEVKGAKNGREVLELFLKEDFQIILLDIHMPVMDGIACVKEIRVNERPEKRNVPIIAITGNDINYNADSLKEYGVTDCLFKPINYDELMEKIIRYTS